MSQSLEPLKSTEPHLLQETVLPPHLIKPPLPCVETLPECAVHSDLTRGM